MQVLPTSAKRSKLETEGELFTIDCSSKKGTKLQVASSNQKSVMDRDMVATTDINVENKQSLSEEGVGNETEDSIEILQTKVAYDDSSIVRDLSVKSSVSPEVGEDSVQKIKQSSTTDDEVAETDVETSGTRVVMNCNGKEVEVLVSGEANMEKVKQLVEQLMKSGNI